LPAAQIVCSERPWSFLSPTLAAAFCGPQPCGGPGCLGGSERAVGMMGPVGMRAAWLPQPGHGTDGGMVNVSGSYPG